MRRKITRENTQKSVKINKKREQSKKLDRGEQREKEKKEKQKEIPNNPNPKTATEVKTSLLIVSLFNIEQGRHKVYTNCKRSNL